MRRAIAAIAAIVALVAAASVDVASHDPDGRRYGGVGPCVQQPSGGLSCRGLDNFGAPSVNGTATQRNVLTASTGLWNTQPSSYSYEWLDCDSNGQNCRAIPGASSAAYTLQASDVGDTIQL